MTRVTFGDAPSPFLSIATVQKHAKEHEKDYPTATKQVSENMYVDGVLTGASKDESEVNLRDELCNFLSKGGFQLTKWASNSPKVMETTAPPFTNIGLDFTGPLYLKVEGSSKLTTSKAYVCIFICQDTRAVHLELLNSMTTEDFCKPFVVWLIDVEWRKRFIQTTYHVS